MSDPTERRPSIGPGRGRRGALFGLAAALVASACTLVTEFDAVRHRENTESNCSDGLDNDGNGLVDCADSTCKQFDFCKENTDILCGDGIDNDADKATDCDDPGCCPYALCYQRPSCGEATAVACGDLKDNDNNGLTDCGDFGCQTGTISACCRNLAPLLVETFSGGGTSCTVEVCNDSGKPTDNPCCTKKHQLCNAFNRERWVSWGMPRPRIQNERFVANQPCNCPASGLISTSDVALSEGLHMEFTANLEKDSSARLAVGLVGDVVIPQNDNDCGDISTMYPMLVGVNMVGTTVQALVQDEVQGSTTGREVGDMHVTIDVQPKGTLVFRLDDRIFHQSSVKVETPYKRVRIILQGHTTRATVDNLVLGMSNRCPSHGTWVSGPIGPSPVLTPSQETGAFDRSSVGSPSVLFDGRLYRMYYTGQSASQSGSRIGLALSDDGQVWKRPKGALSISGESGETQEEPCVLLHEGQFIMAYRTRTGADRPYIALATSADGETWKRTATSLTTGAAHEWDGVDVRSPTITYFQGPQDSKSRLHLFYVGKGSINTAQENFLLPAMGLAHGDGQSFTKYAKNPVLKPALGKFDDRGVEGLHVFVEEKQVLLFYAGLTWGGLTQINLAASEDGITWVRYPQNPLITVGNQGIFGGRLVGAPTLLKQWGAVHMWYEGQDQGGLPSVGYVVNQGKDN